LILDDDEKKGTYFVVFALTKGAFTSCPALRSAAEAAADFASKTAETDWAFESTREGGLGVSRGAGLVVDGPGCGVVPRDEAAEELQECEMVVRCVGQNMWLQA
jgi:hypothetical protein